jgi:hypothetical protein
MPKSETWKPRILRAAREAKRAAVMAAVVHELEVRARKRRV